MQTVPDDVRSMLSQGELDDADVVTSAIASLQEHYKLRFGADDARYVIVDNESEIPDLVDFINGLRDRQSNEVAACTENERKRLMTRVISMRQIEVDF
jgi:hypothetical protein